MHNNCLFTIPNLDFLAYSVPDKLDRFAIRLSEDEIIKADWIYPFLLQIASNLSKLFGLIGIKATNWFMKSLLAELTNTQTIAFSNLDLDTTCLKGLGKMVDLCSINFVIFGHRDLKNDQGKFTKLQIRNIFEALNE
jgi:hypothetical protein